jgi:hypothetical protein
MVPAVVAGVGTALTRVNRVQDALSVINDALDRRTYERSGNFGLYDLLMALGEAQAAAGHLAQALETVRRAETLAQTNHEVAHVARARYLLATILTRHDAAASAATFQEALAYARQCNMRPLETACQRALQVA